APVVHAGLADGEGTERGLKLPGREVAVSNHHPAAGAVPELGEVPDVGLDLGLDGLGEHPAGSLPEDLGQGILRGGGSTVGQNSRTFRHRRILPSREGTGACLDKNKHQGYAALIRSRSTTFRHTSFETG